MSLLPPPPGSEPPTGPVPRAMPYAPTDGLPQRWTADSAKAGLSIPYLGPEPPPSKISGLALIGASGTGAVFFLIRAGLYLHLAALERTFLDRRTPSTLADVQSTTRLRRTIGRSGLSARRASP